MDKKLKQHMGIRLDIGCGHSKHPGFVGIDKLPLDGVDIVHDIEQTPWPLQDECVTTAIASHILEHINPASGIFLNVMNEIWRVMKKDGQFAFVVPYAGSPGYWQDPTHCNGITEATVYYFDPAHPSGLYNFYQPKPWKIEQLTWNHVGNLECVLRKRQESDSYEV